MFSWLFSNTMFTLVALFGVLIYFYIKHLYSLWKRRGVKYLEPPIPFGNFGKTFMQKLSFGEQLQEHNGAIHRCIWIFSINFACMQSSVIDCFADPDNLFQKYGRKVLEMSLKNGGANGRNDNQSWSCIDAAEVQRRTCWRTYRKWIEIFTRC